jgi:MerR family transcriptional regulator, heat shock protein HspR
MRIDPDRPLFPISTVAEIIGCPQKVLRLYDRSGLLRPARTDGKRRLYSQRDVERLEFIHYLTHVRRVNIAGVKVILDLLEHIPPERWEKIIRGIEAEVEALPQEERRALEEGRADVVAALEEAED